LADEDRRWLAERSGGDARFALSSLELAAHATPTDPVAPARIERATLEQVLAQAHLLYDRAGEEHFNLISAFQKSIRNSDAQAGIYWLARMLEAGEDPLYVARRLLRIASEDIGLADPNALVQCVAAAQTVHLLGMPEAALALAQACIYCAQAPKSNRLETAYEAARAAIAAGHRSPVPLHLRNAVTKEMSQLGYGAGYLYAHDDASGVAPMYCLPDDLRDRVFYRPSDRGFEADAAARLREAYRLAHRSVGEKRKGPAETTEP
jgi:putative ATPase